MKQGSTVFLRSPVRKDTGLKSDVMSVRSSLRRRTLANLELGDVMDLGYGSRAGVCGRVCCVQAVHIRQEEEPICLDQGGDLHE